MIMKPRGVSHVSRCRGQSLGVLERFNLKHRHVHKPPSAESVRECCVELERKDLWRWHRDTNGFLDGDAPWRISNMPFAEYPKLPSPELRLWLSNLSQAVMGAFKRVKSMYAQGFGVKTCLESHGWVSKCFVNPRFVPCLVTKKVCFAQ